MNRCTVQLARMQFQLSHSTACVHAVPTVTQYTLCAHAVPTVTQYTLCAHAVPTVTQYSLHACSVNCYTVQLAHMQCQLSHILKFSALCRVMSWISTTLLEDPKLKGVVKVLWIIFISTFIFTAVTVSLPLARHKWESGNLRCLKFVVRMGRVGCRLG